MALVLYAFMHLYSIFNLRLFLSVLFLFLEIWYCNARPRYQNLLTLFAIFYESKTEGTNFRIMFIHVLRLYNVHVLYCIQFV